MRKASKYRNRGFVHAGGVLGARIRETSGKRGFAEARLLTQWPEIVGAELAKIAKPVKVSYKRQGMGARLTVLALGAVGPELQMQLPKLKERVNACYGYNAISEISITQTTSGGFAEPASAFKHAPGILQKTLDPKKSERLKNHVSRITDAGLRAQLEKLGKNVLLNN